MKQGNIVVGHPIDVASGIQFTAWHDAEISGLLPLIWRRYYSTHLLNRPPSVLGKGWAHCFGMSLRQDLEGFTMTGPQGEEIHFDDSSAAPSSTNPILNFGHFMELRREGDEYRVLHWHDWRSKVEIYTFGFLSASDILKLKAISIPSDNKLLLSYGDDGQLYEVAQSVEGRVLLLSYDNDGRLYQLSMRSPISSTEILATYEYDEHNRLVAVFDALRIPISYEYDNNDRLKREVGRAGASYSMKYDAEGRCIESAGVGGYRARRLSYEPEAKLTRVTDSLGNTTIFKLNDAGQVEAKILPNGAQEVTRFDAEGRISIRVGPSGETIATSYDQRGNVSSVTYPRGGQIRFRYNLDHQVVDAFQLDGGHWNWEYAGGAVVAITDPAGAKTKIKRDDHNLICEIQTPAGNALKVERDKEWSFERYVDRFGVWKYYRFDKQLRISEIGDALGILRQFEYDAGGYLTAIIEGDGTRRLFSSNPSGWVLQHQSGAGRVTRFEYNENGLKTRMITPGAFSYVYQWDTEGRLTGVINPKSELATFAYDSVGNIVSTTFFDGRVEQYEYDASARRTKRRKADGSELTFIYDAEGNLLGVADRRGTLSENKYDVCSRLVETRTLGCLASFEYDYSGWPVSEIENGHQVDSKYHPFGELAERHVAGAANGSLAFTYDVRRRLVLVHNKIHDLVRYEYDAANLLASRRFGSVVEKFRYDARRRLTHRELTRNGQLLSARTYDYDADSNVTRMIDAGSITFYSYNPDGQLVKVTSDSRGSVEYDYDSCGNLTRKGPSRLEYGKGNRLLANGAASYERDANGNLVSSNRNGLATKYCWNTFDQLVKIIQADGTITEFGYDGIGRRLWKETGGTKTEYVWAGRGLACEITGLNITSYLLGRFIPHLIWQNDAVRITINSHAGRPESLIDQRGTVIWEGSFDAWGSPLTTSSVESVHFGLPGQYWDSTTACYYNGFRYYNSADGSYISPDPIGLLGGFNEYWFAPNPINWSDPLGLRCGQTHLKVKINDDLKGQGGEDPPTRADWFAKQDAFNNGILAAQGEGNPIATPTPAQYAIDRAVGNDEAAAARIAQGMGPGVQADHPVDLRVGGGQGQSLYPLASGVNGSVGSQTGAWARSVPANTATPMFDLYDSQGNLVRQG